MLSISFIMGILLCVSSDLSATLPSQAVRFLTELLHKCLSRRMADRILEQAANLPIQSSGDNVLNEFKREVAYGIYSRKRCVA